MAEPQWEIPLYVWLTILALSRSWSCFQSCTPQLRPRSAIFHPYKSETKSIPVFFLGVPPPLPECLPFIPYPVIICLTGIQVYIKARRRVSRSFSWEFPPLPECLPFIPYPVIICLTEIQVYVKARGRVSRSFSWGVPSSPLPECFPFIPYPVIICLTGIQVYIKARRRVSRSFSWESPPLPSPSTFSFIPDPVNICLAGIHVFLGRRGIFSAPSGNRPMTLIRITGKGSVDSCF